MKKKVIWAIIIFMILLGMTVWEVYIHTQHIGQGIYLKHQKQHPFSAVEKRMQEQSS